MRKRDQRKGQRMRRKKGGRKKMKLQFLKAKKKLFKKDECSTMLKVQ